MKVALLTREYPPEVYGGAGIHLGYLARELARLTRLEVHCFGGERLAEEGIWPARWGEQMGTFTWSAVGRRTVFLYQTLVDRNHD
jgi:hypothetical protein